jgi:glycosyltransferase involved in cell wall biosynthesis
MRSSVVLFSPSRWRGQVCAIYLRFRGLVFDLVKRGNLKEPNNIAKLSVKLETLGFTEQAFGDLDRLAQGPRISLTTGFASWRLALWIFRTQQSPFHSADLLRLLRRGLACPLPRELHFQLRLLQVLSAAGTPHRQMWSGPAWHWARRYRTRAADFLFAALLLEPNAEQKAQALGRIYQRDRLVAPQLLPAVEGVSLLDRLHCPVVAPLQPTEEDQPLVSVIIACFNAADTIETALRSLQQQSWPNLEIIIVDDCSTDDTVSVVSRHLSERVRLLRMSVNGGAYQARNAALADARGEFVTLHDADDWSHPAKIAIQSRFLQANSAVAACTTRRVRVSENLDQIRLSSRGWILGLNTSSLMVRRGLLVCVFRGWDVVRFAADTELLKRIQALLGKRAIKHLQSGPLTLQRLTESSASSLSKTGYPGYTFGTRHLYAKSYEYAHRHRLPPFPAAPTAQDRSFLAPKVMNPAQERGCHYDVIVASEFRMKGGSTRSSIEELKVQQQYGISSAVVPMYRYDLTPSITEVDMLYEHLDPASVQFLAYGEEASCDLLIIRYPPVLRFSQSYLPRIRARNVVVIVNQPPFSDYGPKGVKRYELVAANAQVSNWLGVEPLWYPIGPLVREALHRHHGDELTSIRLADNDWTNIIDLSTWLLRDDAPCLCHPGGPIRIGRHSRDDALKWIEDLDALQMAYPSSRDFEICVLGGAKSVASFLGGDVPGNWTVHAFGSMDPQDFLATLDFFVYYTHTSWVESFGRVIIEAMAIGVPVILPSPYRQLFADAALYAEPADVQGLIRSLVANPEDYRRHVRQARRFVENNFGHGAHLRRLQTYGIEANDLG